MTPPQINVQLPTDSQLTPAGEELIIKVQRRFPRSGRCARCGFRLQHHVPSNHPFEPKLGPIVVSVRRSAAPATGART